jgi:purine-binding chemotaxis protein CheW
MAEKQLTSILSFRIKDEFFAFDTDSVRNILELGTITRVPNTKEYFKGVINLHGNIIPVVDLRMMMGMQDIKDTKDTVIVVLSDNGQADSMIGFIVDGVKEVFTLNEDYALQDTIIDSTSGTLVNVNYKGTLKMGQDFIHIISHKELMEEIEQ